MKRPLFVFVIASCAVLFGFTCYAEPLRHEKGIRVSTYEQEVRTFYTIQDGLPSEDVLAVAVAPDGSIYAGTAEGLARFKEGQWSSLSVLAGTRVSALAPEVSGVLAIAGDALYRVVEGDAKRISPVPQSSELTSLAKGETAYLGTGQGLFELAGTDFRPVEALNGLLGSSKEVRQVAAGLDGEVAVAALSGLFVRMNGSWEAIHPRDGAGRSWAPVDVRGVAYDIQGRLWFASSQGVGCRDHEWTLYTGQEGLPYNQFTVAVPGEESVVWLGTDLGAIRYDGETWEYRQGKRWLPSDLVRAIAVTPDGNAWFATPSGVGLIERRPITLRDKAEFFVKEIDKYHRRTPFGYVLDVNLPEPGVKANVKKHDSDNDGLWTSMYGASECFAYAATGDPAAKGRATKALEAVSFLSEVTQGGTHPAPPGFPARTILPTSGPDPNEGRIERDRETQKRDPQWKVIDPRWPVSEDGQWYWKSDTSSDELDGHYFFYATYYDLVAETEQEKERVREVVQRITDHLVDHDFQLVDHDGKPTRWARYSPKDLNFDPRWAGARGLNSLSILSYLKTAQHITGDPKFGAAYDSLVTEHGYAVNTLMPKMQTGPGTGNQSDDEMAFMDYYDLLKYETDPVLRTVYTYSLSSYWRLESPELCPLFNYIYAASLSGATSSIGGYRIGSFSAPTSCFEEALDSLKRYPLDLIAWEMKNSHRLDIVPLQWSMGRDKRGYRVSGRVLPIDERIVDHWNHDPWTLDYGGNGTNLSDGASFLLPYYMGVYHGFIIEE